jgi:putative chitinase
MVTAQHLSRLKISEAWLAPLNSTFERFGIQSVNQQAGFIGECGHECNNFRTLEENLNYKPATLMRVWPSRFPTQEIANQYRTPKAIANRVYGGRMGNREEASGDGYRFRGRGCIQLTGYSNYFHAGRALGVDFVTNPDLVATPQYAALTAGWFWSTHGCNSLADAANWTALTKKINGGTIGLQERINHIDEAILVLTA